METKVYFENIEKILLEELSKAQSSIKLVVAWLTNKKLFAKLVELAEKGITVNGQASFGGPVSAPSITIDSLSIKGDVQFSRHLDAGGGTPSVSGGNAIGSGGTVTVSGTDTAGTVTINVGSGASGGALASVTFASAFNGNPHVIITPIGALGSAPVSGTGQFYLSSRTTTGFTIATSAALGAGSISFDYVAID